MRVTTGRVYFRSDAPERGQSTRAARSLPPIFGAIMCLNSQEPKQYFISDENFNLLKTCQKTIYDATELMPAMRRLVNALITPENIEKVKKEYLNKYL